MKNSKKLFIAIAAVFFGVVGFLSYDISSKTTFPRSKPQFKEKLMKKYLDSTKVDTLQDKTLEK